ncbi:hypothetical protein BXZ70DRAFT_1029523 [Cristinia sonorae]|uniref:Carbohydrate esterase family 16 protein n=1 Tax=Cristinia sonorae TaxID=1940300 RepID=A0A8K0UXL1_9AGAR|nr:hypothetical protein BXZ70DRAFT_1029523 [Cristinia sonorae]
MRRRPTAQQQSTLLSSPVVTARSWADWIASADDFTGRQELNVHGYAVKGARVAGLASQVDRFLSDLSLEKCGGLTRSETKEEAMLFAIWLGINDFATSQTPESMQLLLETVSEQQTRLYNEAGARNFLFVDIPPVHRTPAAARASEEQRQTLATTLKLWHTLLSTRVSSHPGISALLFSSYAFFTGLLDDPTTYGFRDEDVVNAGPTKSRIWLDELHPTSGVHRALSLSILSFLQTAAHATE